MRYALIVSLTIVFACLSAQKLQWEVDSFEGDSILTTDFEILSKYSINGNHGTALAVTGYSDSAVLRFKMEPTKLYNTFREGDVLKIKMGSGQIIELPATELVVVAGTGDGGVGWPISGKPGFSLVFDLTADDLVLLGDQEIVMFQLTTENGYINADVKSKRAKKVRELIEMFRREGGY